MITKSRFGQRRGAWKQLGSDCRLMCSLSGLRFSRYFILVLLTDNRKACKREQLHWELNCVIFCGCEHREQERSKQIKGRNRLTPGRKYLKDFFFVFFFITALPKQFSSTSHIDHMRSSHTLCFYVVSFHHSQTFFVFLCQSGTAA